MADKHEHKRLTLYIPLIDQGTASIIETSDLGELPVLEFIDEDGLGWVFNWATREYEREEAVPLWLG